MLSYVRRAADPDDFLLVCCNFTPVVRQDYLLGAPRGGWYQEVFNSDSEHYGGSNVGNGPGVQADDRECHGRPYSLEITLAPLGISIFKLSR